MYTFPRMSPLSSHCHDHMMKLQVLQTKGTKLYPLQKFQLDILDVISTKFVALN